MNEVILVSATAMIVAQLIKFPIYFFKEGKTNFSIIVSTGSMPSSHSAVVVACALEVGILSGFSSQAFGLAFVLMGITIHDAVKVRGESGKQASKINQISLDIQKIMQIVDTKTSTSERTIKLKELIGHTTSEVLGGILVGIIVFVFYNFV